MVRYFRKPLYMEVILPYEAQQGLHMGMRSHVHPIAPPSILELGPLSPQLRSGSLSLRTMRESSAPLTWSV